MNDEILIGAAATAALLASGAAVAIGGAWALRWWRMLPAAERPPPAALERLQRAGLLWLCALGVWGVSAAVISWAPRGGLFAELSFGLPALLGMLAFAGRAAFGCLVAAGIDAAIWPAISAHAILWPPEGSRWRGVPAPLRGVALAAWAALYLLVIAGAIWAGGPAYGT